MWCFWVTMKRVVESGTTNVMEFRRFARSRARYECDEHLDFDYAEMRDQGWDVSWRAIEPTELEDIKEMNSHAIWS